jgi:hypothetical protein
VFPGVRVFSFTREYPSGPEEIMKDFRTADLTEES